MQDESQGINHARGTLIHEQKASGRHFQIREGDGLRWLHFDKHDVQAIMDLAQPERLITPYSQTMLSALLLQPDPHRLLNLGLGGAGFERFFAHHWPRLQITSVEASTRVIDLARRFFRLPPEHPVVVEEAAPFITRQRAGYGLIFCDIHGGRGHPDCLTSPAFHQGAYRSLTPDGVYAINLLPEGYPHLLGVLTSLRQSFSHVQLLEVPARRNLILLASRQPPPDAGTLAERAVHLNASLGLPPGLLRAPGSALPPRSGHLKAG